MMKTIWDHLTFFKYSDCKSELHQVAQANKQVQMLECQVTNLLGQIQELKAINNYQTFDLERTISKLEELLSLRVQEATLLESENRLLKDKIDARKKRRAERMRFKRAQQKEQQ